MGSVFISTRRNSEAMSPKFSTSCLSMRPGLTRNVPILSGGRIRVNETPLEMSEPNGAGIGEVHVNRRVCGMIVNRQLLVRFIANPDDLHHIVLESDPVIVGKSLRWILRGQERRAGQQADRGNRSLHSHSNIVSSATMKLIHECVVR